MNEVISNVLMTVITVGFVVALKFIIGRSEELKKSVKDERVRKAIDKALEIVTLSVNVTNQEFVQALKDKGGFGKKEAEEAFNATKVKVLELLSDETKKVLDKEFGNTNVFLNNAIESKVWEGKKK